MSLVGLVCLILGSVVDLLGLSEDLVTLVSWTSFGSLFKYIHMGIKILLRSHVIEKQEKT